MAKDSEANTTRLTPVAASRPDIVEPFIAGMVAEEIVESNAISPGAQLVLLRCRVTPATKPPVSAGATHSEWSRWLALNGLMPILERNTDAEAINALSSLLAEREARLGAESPYLIGPLVALADMSLNRSMMTGDIAPTRHVELFERAFALIRRVGGTERFFAAPYDPRIIYSALASAANEDEMRAIMLARVRGWAGSVSFDSAYDDFSDFDENDAFTSADKLELFGMLLARGEKVARPDDPRLIALRVKATTLLIGRGDFTAARAMIKPAGLPTDLCAFMSTAPRLREQTIEPNDFPRDPLEARIEGASYVQFDLDATGDVKRADLILAVPAFAFDDTVKREVADFRFDPARADGRAAACRGYARMVRWTLPKNDDAPSLGAPEWRPGS